jgi:phage terminase small subunit
MAKLSDMRRNFVLALMNQGNRNATQAAADAGYSTNSYGSLKVQAHVLWHDEEIQEALHEEATRRLKGMLPVAVKVVGDILENAQEGGATRLKAAQVIMDRAGVHAVSERINREEPLESNPDQIKRIAALAQMLGLPVEQLLGARLKAIAPPVEAEYVEMSTEGLEGLI